jgi:adenylyltransferase/sulfurtransferase
VIADSDTVDLTNLQRQILHSTAAIGHLKTESARETLHRLNPAIQIETRARLEGDALAAEIAAADVVLDCSDNFATRYAVNRACVRHRKPLVAGAAIRFSGQVTVFDPRSSGGPCYNCLFPESEEAEEARCAITGVFAPLTGIIGATQAAEALKLIASCGTPLTGRLLWLDALTMRWRDTVFGRDSGCGVCGG